MGVLHIFRILLLSNESCHVSNLLVTISVSCTRDTTNSRLYNYIIYLLPMVRMQCSF